MAHSIVKNYTLGRLKAITRFGTTLGQYPNWIRFFLQGPAGQFSDPLATTAVAECAFIQGYLSDGTRDTGNGDQDPTGNTGQFVPLPYSGFWYPINTQDEIFIEGATPVGDTTQAAVDQKADRLDLLYYRVRMQTNVLAARQWWWGHRVYPGSPIIDHRIYNLHAVPGPDPVLVGSNPIISITGMEVLTWFIF